MKYIIFLLAAMAGAVRGAEVGAEVQGFTKIDVDPCSAEDQEMFYQKCVLQVAVSKGVVLSRRLEVRGDRDLGMCSGCGPCPECYPKGHFCYTWCQPKRRLTLTDVTDVTDEAAHIVKGQIQKAANECLDKKIEEGYTCLGDAKDLTIKIYLS